MKIELFFSRNADNKIQRQIIQKKMKIQKKKKCLKLPNLGNLLFLQWNKTMDFNLILGENCFKNWRIEGKIFVSCKGSNSYPFCSQTCIYLHNGYI